MIGFFSGTSDPKYFIPSAGFLSDQSAGVWNTTVTSPKRDQQRIANGVWGSSGNHKAVK